MFRRSFLYLAAGSLMTISGFIHAENVESYDLIVVGGGAGGLSAALSASEKGLKVLLLEKQSFLGGDTLISGGYFNAACSSIQKQNGIQDSVELFTQHIIESGKGFNDIKIAAKLAQESSLSLDWLMSYGLKFLPEVYLIYGGKWARSHKPIMHNGQGYIYTLSEACMKKKVAIRTGCQVTSIVQNSTTGAITGVSFIKDGKTYLARAKKGIVIASGGFGANRQMIAEFNPAMGNLSSETSPGATGEMIKEAQRLGASLTNLGFIECVPGSSEDLKFPVRLDYDPNAVILVNEKGERFTNESGLRMDIAKDFFAGGYTRCYSIADSQAVEEIEPMRRKHLYRALYAGKAFRFKSIAELARGLGLPRDSLIRSFEQKQFLRRLKEPFWAVDVKFRVHQTLGGIRIDEQARVLDKNDSWIQGLWAAGSCIGNLHGYNRIGGNGINSAVTFGRIAGEEASRA